MAALTMPSYDSLREIRLSDEELQRVLRRVGLGKHSLRELPATKETLYLVHRAFFETVPFENLAVFLCESVSLDVSDIVDKICGVRPPTGDSEPSTSSSARGGYCFELNKLLAAALSKLGFEVEPKLGRVHNDHGEGTGPARPPVTHVTLVVRLRGEPDTHYLCDAGFGRTALFEPLPIALEGPVESHGMRVELRRATQASGFGYSREDHELWYEKEGTWVRGYNFSLQEDAQWLDCTAPNMIVYGHFDSKFTQIVWVEARTAATHYILFGATFTADGSGGKEIVDVRSPEHLQYILDHYFGISVSQMQSAQMYGITTCADVAQKWLRLTLMREPHRAPLVGAAAARTDMTWKTASRTISQPSSVLGAAALLAITVAVGGYSRR